MAKELPITEFDRITLNQTMHMFKAMIPFLDYPMQKSLSLLIRINELQQTMQFYSRPENINHFTTCSCNAPKQPIRSVNDLLDNEEMINTVLKYCPEQYANMINSFRQFSKMSDLFNMMNTAGAGGDFTSMFNGNGLNPDLMQMLNPDLLNSLFNGANPFAGFDDAGAAGGPSAAAADDEAFHSGEHPQEENMDTPEPAAGGKSGPSHASGYAPFAGGGLGSMINNFMNPQQQEMYNEYIHQLDRLDFEKNQ